MLIVLNLVFAFLLGWLALWILESVGAPNPLALLVALVVGLLVYAANLGSQVL